MISLSSGIPKCLLSLSVVQLICSSSFMIHFEIIFCSSNSSKSTKVLSHLLVFQYIFLSNGNWIYIFSCLIPWRHKSSGWSPDFSWLISPAKYHLSEVIEIELLNNRQETQRKHTRRHLGASSTDMGLLLRILIVLEEYNISLTRETLLSFPKKIFIFLKMITLQTWKLNLGKEKIISM